MSELFREPGRGDDILSAFKRLMAVVRRERVTAGDGIVVKQTESGKTISAIRQHSPGGSSVLFSFLTTDDNSGTENENPSLTMEPGDVHFGPDETTAWADFTGESTTVTPTASNTAWYVWLVIDVESLAVTWKEGAAITALTDEEKLTKINWPLVKVTLEWSEDETPLGTVTAVKHLQCGDVMVSRAAG